MQRRYPSRNEANRRRAECADGADAAWTAGCLRELREHGIGIVLVLIAGKLTGLVTDLHITFRVLAENRDRLTPKVGDICSTELTVLGPDDDVDQATRLVRDRAVRRIPVLQDAAHQPGTQRSYRRDCLLGRARRSPRPRGRRPRRAACVC